MKRRNTKVKHGGDLDFFYKMFDKYLQKHWLDTIAYCEGPTSIGSMILLSADYSKLMVEEVKKQNKDVYNQAYDK